MIPELQYYYVTIISNNGLTKWLGFIIQRVEKCMYNHEKHFARCLLTPWLQRKREQPKLKKSINEPYVADNLSNLILKKYLILYISMLNKIEFKSWGVQPYNNNDHSIEL